MGYEIPQQLEHKEKIMFGLTFSQLSWAFLFGTITVIIFTKDIPDIQKYSLMTATTTVGLFFMFFDFSKWIKNFYNYLKFRDARIGTHHMNQFLQIKRIENNTIYARKEVAVIQINPMNFNLKTNEEKDSIIYGFQKFLNN